LDLFLVQAANFTVIVFSRTVKHKKIWGTTIVSESLGTVECS
jgi:hypothetical protein